MKKSFVYSLFSKFVFVNILLACFVFTNLQAQNLITNGSFETDDLSPSNFNTTFQGTPASHDASNGLSTGGSKSFPASWDYMDGPGYYINGGDAQDGSRFIYTSGVGNCINYAPPAGACKAYKVCFYAAAFTASGSQTASKIILHLKYYSNASGTTQVGTEPEIKITIPPSASWSDLTWNKYTYIFITPQTTQSALLSFSNDDAASGVCYDNISLTEITSSVATELATNNNPTCGNPLSLCALSSGTYIDTNTKYNWSGPNAFTSTQQKPTVAAVVSATDNGTYNLTVTAGPSGKTCAMTASTIVNVCNVTCTSPTAGTNTLTAGTCSGATPNNDAKIDFTGITNADKAGIVEGATYTGTDYATTTGVVTAGATSFTGLKHNTQYTVRIFNAANDCFIDLTITTPTKTCVIPCPSPNCGTLSVQKL